MLGYYKRHVLRLASLLQRLRVTPTDLDLLEHLQREILGRLLHTEAKIAEYKSSIAEDKRRLRHERLPKPLATALKREIERLRARVDDCNWLLYVWRAFGDGIAFTYLDKWAVKSALYDNATGREKELPGHLTGKIGLTNELALILDAKKNGVPAVLADITNTIRHGDVCLLGASDPYLIEVKSSTNQNERASRQNEIIQTIHDYLAKDEGHDIRGASFLRRVAIHGEEINYVGELNAALEVAARDGVCIVDPEPGVRYIVTSTLGKIDIPRFFEGLVKPIVCTLNEAKNEQAWGCYLPFTLLIEGPELLYAFLKGDLYVMVAFDPSVLIRRYAERGLIIKFLDEPDWAYSIEQSGVPGTSKVSRAFFGRIAFEFISWDWVIEFHLSNVAKYAEFGTSENPGMDSGPPTTTWH